MRIVRMYYFLFVLFASCNKKGEGNIIINSKSIYDTIQRNNVDSLDFHTQEVISLVSFFQHF